MAIQTKWRNHFQEHKTLFIVLVVGLLLVELEIFAMAAMKSGQQSRLQILDHNNNVVYSVKSARLDSQDKAKFERTFGPLSNYQVKVVTENRPFPFRAWFAAAVGLPVGLVLLMGFFIRAYETLIIRHRPTASAQDASHADATGRLEGVVARISRLNIFAIGGLVLILALGLWAGPGMLAEFGRYGIATIMRYKWIVIALVLTFLALVVWIIYLRYLLARKSIETQAEVEK